MIADLPVASAAVLVERETRPRSTATPVNLARRIQANDTSQISGQWSLLPDNPPWCSNTLNAMERLLALNPNWDTYGALKVDAEIVRGALVLLSMVMLQDSAPPSVVPTSRGGLQLEWHKNGVDLEVEFISPSKVRGYFEDLNSGESWERDLTYDLRPLVQAIKRLSNH